jgi:D-psicose/D-tagatose/L-ribulose 3-epimerase
MKYGMNLLLWTGEMHEGLRPVLASLKDMGYDGVEVPMFSLDVAQWSRWGGILDDLGLQRTAVTVRGVEDNPISPDPAVRRLGLENNKRTIDCCQAVGAQTLVGPYHSALGHFSGSGPSQDEWQWAVEGMRATAEHADQATVMLAVEYLNRFETYLLNTAADTARFVQEVDHPRFRMMYDTFHANIEEKDKSQAIQAAAPYLAHVHISENDRSTPGAGGVDWQSTFDSLHRVGYDGWMVIEAFGLALPELAAATKIWRRMFETEEQLARDGLAFMRSEVERRAAATRP